VENYLTTLPWDPQTMMLERTEPIETQERDSTITAEHTVRWNCASLVSLSSSHISHLCFLRFQFTTPIMDI